MRRKFNPNMLIVDEASFLCELEDCFNQSELPQIGRMLSCQGQKQLRPIPVFTDPKQRMGFSAFERLLQIGYPPTMLDVEYEASQSIHDAKLLRRPFSYKTRVMGQQSPSVNQGKCHHHTDRT
jgi:hypothetical protein